MSLQRDCPATAPLPCLGDAHGSRS